MKIHAISSNQNITFKYDVVSDNQKKLRRIPHIFSKILELPFRSDADVSVYETSDSLQFVVETDDVINGDDIWADTIEINPGFTKVVIRGNNAMFDFEMDELDLDVWRFRLPGITLPEIATAIYSDGKLVVTVPKLVTNLDIARKSLF